MSVRSLKEELHVLRTAQVNALVVEKDSLAMETEAWEFALAIHKLNRALGKGDQLAAKIEAASDVLIKTKTPKVKSDPPAVVRLCTGTRSLKRA